MFVADMSVDLVFDRPTQQIVNAGRKQKRCEVLLLKWERLWGGGLGWTDDPYQNPNGGKIEWMFAYTHLKGHKIFVCSSFHILPIQVFLIHGALVIAFWFPSPWNSSAQYTPPWTFVAVGYIAPMSSHVLGVNRRTSPWRFSWKWPMSVRTRGVAQA